MLPVPRAELEAIAGAKPEGLMLSRRRLVERRTDTAREHARDDEPRAHPTSGEDREGDERAAAESRHDGERARTRMHFPTQPELGRGLPVSGGRSSFRVSADDRRGVGYRAGVGHA